MTTNCTCPGCPAAGPAPRAAKNAADLLEALDRYIQAIDVTELTTREAMSLLEIGTRVERLALGVDPPGLLILPENLKFPVRESG